MKATATDQYVRKLHALKAGELSRLRRNADMGLDASLEAFDLFTGLWWPLRRVSPRAPRREVAWLVAKLYAQYPLPQEGGKGLPEALGRLLRRKTRADARIQVMFDELLELPLSQTEPVLRRLIGFVADEWQPLDWVRLTDDLSIWAREHTRLRWANAYLG